MPVHSELLFHLTRPPLHKDSETPPLLLLLHGVGSNEEDLFELGQYVDPRFFIVSARGPITLMPGAYAWYHVQFLPDDTRINFREVEHSRQDWGTLIFNYGRNEVRSFLLSSARYWLEEFHIDGLRVDAVASMLYLDYSRKDGEWLPNQYGGRENLEAIDFLHRMNTLAHQVPGAITAAEESTAWPGVSRPVHLGGLGFTYKWNMGWMHDILEYARLNPIHRRWWHNQVTFSMLYAYHENFILPFSHDEVVHGKGSMIGKMAGDSWQKAANLRAVYGFLFTHPGKKLMFMGDEFGQWPEWNHDGALEWAFVNGIPHRGLGRLALHDRLAAGVPYSEPPDTVQVQEYRQHDADHDASQEGKDTGKTATFDLNRAWQAAQARYAAHQPQDSTQHHDPDPDDHQPARQHFQVRHIHHLMMGILCHGNGKSETGMDGDTRRLVNIEWAREGRRTGGGWWIEKLIADARKKNADIFERR